MSKFFSFLKEHNVEIQTISTIVIAIFSFFTFFSWKTSVDILNNQQKTDLILNRAYVSVTDAVIKKRSDGMFYSGITIKNSGNTPASSVKVAFYDEFKSGERVGVKGVPTLNSNLGPGNQRVEGIISNRESLLEDIEPTSNHLVMDIEYEDYSKNKYRYEIKFYVRPSINADIFDYGIWSQNETLTE